MNDALLLWQTQPGLVALLLWLAWLGCVWPVEIASRNIFVPYLTGFAFFLAYSLAGIFALPLLLAALLPALLPLRLELTKRPRTTLRILRENRIQWVARVSQVGIDIAGMAVGALIHAALFTWSGLLPPPFPISEPDSLWRYLFFVISLQVIFTLCAASIEQMSANFRPFVQARLGGRRKYTPSNEIFGPLFIAAGPLQYLVYFFNQVRGDGFMPLLIAVTWTLLMNFAFNIWGQRGIRLTDSSRELDLARRVVRLGDDAARIVHRVRHEVALIGIGINRLRKQMDGLDSQKAQQLLTEIERLEAVRRNLQQATATQAGDTGDSPATPADASLGSVLAKQVELLQVKALEHDITLQLHDDPAIRHPLNDPAMFGEGVFNVIENAISSARRFVTVRSAMDGARIVVSIDDDGHGMNDASLARAFEPFFTTKADGTGMGLVIARGAVENERGSIVLGNLPGAPPAGFRVTILLPVVSPPAGG